MVYFSYRQYYPPLQSELSHRPYSPRIKREEEHQLPTHHDGRFQQMDNHALPMTNIEQGSDNDQDQVRVEGYEEGETVKRPGPGSMREVWRQGSDGAGERI